MTEENSAQWHDEPTDYAQIGKLPRFEAASANDAKHSTVSSSLNITAAAADPELLDLPWHIALEDWPAENLAALPRGISRHIVRFAHLGRSVIAIKETSEHLARHEYHMLRKLARLDVPCVEPVAVITGPTTLDGLPPKPLLVSRSL